MQIGNVKITKPVIMAPMAGVSNGAFRRLCYEFGAGLMTCEMVSDKAIYYANEKTMKMLELDDDIHPVYRYSAQTPKLWNWLPSSLTK